MQKIYNQVIKYIVASGKRIKNKAGKIADIGVKKMYSTEEDIKIERGLKKIIKGYNQEHELYSEEENDVLLNAINLWVADPISGTKTLIEGNSHYAIVVAHMRNKVVQFAAVYDPSVNELFTAIKGGGAYLNGKKIKVAEKDRRPKVLYYISHIWLGKKIEKDINYKLNCNGKIEAFRPPFGSFALGHCYMACGRCDGAVTIEKDNFCSYACSLIAQEAGGRFTNFKGQKNFKNSDNNFISGNKATHKLLLKILKSV